MWMPFLTDYVAMHMRQGRRMGQITPQVAFMGYSRACFDTCDLPWLKICTQQFKLLSRQTTASMRQALLHCLVETVQRKWPRSALDIVHRKHFVCMSERRKGNTKAASTSANSLTTDQSPFQFFSLFGATTNSLINVNFAPSNIAVKYAQEEFEYELPPGLAR